MTTRILETAADVIESLGGTVKTARIADVRPSQVSGWRATNRMGAKSFLVIQRELSDRGLTAPPSLWGMIE